MNLMSWMWMGSWRRARHYSIAGVVAAVACAIGLFIVLKRGGAKTATVGAS